MRLFKRYARLTVWRSKPDQFFTPEANAVIIEGLRLRFSVEKNTHSEPNKASVIVSNLSESTRTAFQSRPLLARLDAGYVQADGSLQLARIFSGDVIHGFSRREGTDWETTLQVHDGHRAFRFGLVAKSFRAGARASDVAAELCKAMGLTMSEATAARLRLASFVRGHVINGPAAREMSRLIDAIPSMVTSVSRANASNPRLRWSIQDGQFQVLADDEVRPGQALDVSQLSGLIGSPDYGSPTESKGTPVLKAKMLLEARAIPGGSVRIRSVPANGYFRIEKVKHTGGTGHDDQEFYTEIEARPQASGGTATQADAGPLTAGGISGGSIPYKSPP